jgi:Flp pilus assembly protein TadB
MAEWVLLIITIAFFVLIMFVYIKFAQIKPKKETGFTHRDPLTPEQEKEIANDPKLKKIIDETFKNLEESGKKRLRSVAIKFEIFLLILYLTLTLFFKIHINLILYAVVALLGFFIAPYIILIIIETIRDTINTYKNA